MVFEQQFLKKSRDENVRLIWSQKIPGSHQSWDENIRLIPSRKIPGSRLFWKNRVPSHPELKFLRTLGPAHYSVSPSKTVVRVILRKGEILLCSLTTVSHKVFHQRALSNCQCAADEHHYHQCCHQCQHDNNIQPKEEKVTLCSMRCWNCKVGKVGGQTPLLAPSSHPPTVPTTPQPPCHLANFTRFCSTSNQKPNIVACTLTFSRPGGKGLI